jgi:hypothetical protein
VDLTSEGPSLQNDKAWLTSAGFAAGPRNVSAGQGSMYGISDLGLLEMCTLYLKVFS